MGCLKLTSFESLQHVHECIQHTVQDEFSGEWLRARE